MLEKALIRWFSSAAALQERLSHLDDAVDHMYSESYELVMAQIHEHSQRLNALLYCLSVSRHLERIADLATNIAEDVSYMIEWNTLYVTSPFDRVFLANSKA